jgi:hypothetical protein
MVVVALGAQACFERVDLSIPSAKLIGEFGDGLCELTHGGAVH